ncbi:ATP-binding cassette domain-containing protein [Streptomyces griseomycini]|uniref:ATP-binding cassette subfamily C protein n=1 Tax=Streptomyces griseomycini TaxID=66895 RepID=A0A7W7LZE9_9ACTN|nr:ATP-binding cassette domain-containing protein [Streptomyces griseomycini]MBB4899054.1 ATP-binding cassette subfamily C protein [Streptomyces griseomycini]GGR21607.1 ABC transporter ATP-binding protein [Streptomyces griseomycini]
MTGAAGSRGEAKDTGSGALRRTVPPARRFLARRKGVLARLALWSVAEAGQAFVVGYGVAHAVDQGFLASDTRRGLGWLAVAAVAVLLGAPVMRGVFAQLAGLTEPLRDGLVRRAVDRSLAGALARPGGTDRAAVSRLTNQVEIARDSFAGLVLTLRSFVFTAAGALLGLLSLHPALLVVVLPPLLAGLALFLATLRPMAAAQRRALAADEALGDHAARARAALRDLTACGTGPEVERRAAELVAGAAASARVLARWAAVRTAALGVAGHLPVLTLLVTVPWLRERGVTAGALLGAFTYLVQSLLPAVHTLMTALGAAGSRLLVVVDRIAGPAPQEPAHPSGRPPAADAVSPGDHGASVSPEDRGAPAAAGAGAAGTPRSARAARPGVPTARGPAAAVEFRAVTLSYGVRAEPVLDSLDLCVAPGEHIAVVGPSGIGKSTLTRLVAGMLAPSSGEVRVAGRPVTGGTADELGALRVLVPQEAYVFAGTVGENLTYLRPDACRADVDATVRSLALRPLVERLGGLDAPLRPDELSQGERQLVALARAHLSAAPLLLLDEATCHLDPASEARAEEALARRPGTLLVVAHRLSSAVRADRVLVLDGVRTVCGTHREVLARSPLYRDLTGHWNGGSHR